MSSMSVDDYAVLVAQHLATALQPRTETVTITSALGRLTATSVRSPIDLPLFRNSQMDGFAVRSMDVATPPVTLPIAGIVAAGAVAQRTLAPGTAVQIMTGAVVPDGADAVVPVEDTSHTATDVTITRGRAAGEFVRDAGSDARAGDEILPSGLLLAPRHLAVLAAAGIHSVEVRARMRVAIITTGAELVAPGETPSLGQLFDANGVALAALVESCGAEVSAVIRNGDDLVESFAASLKVAARDADLVITSGGISMGEFEVVRELLEPLGARVGAIRMQPGGPQLLASFDGIPVIGFPGNPVSTQISFEVLLAPLLREHAGLARPARVRRAIQSPIVSIEGKRQFLRGRVLADETVEVVAGPGSHLVAALAAANVLIDVPAEIVRLEEGELVESWQL